MTTIVALPPLLGNLLGGAIFCNFGGVGIRWDCRNPLSMRPRTGVTLGPWLGAPAGAKVMQLPISGTVIPGDILAAPLPKSLDLAARQIDDTIRVTSDDVLLVGYSKGAQSISRWLDQYADRPDAPDPDRVRIVLWGNPLRKYGGYGVGHAEFGGRIGTATRTDTPYPVTDIALQYDGFADNPTGPGDAAHQNANQDRTGINFARAIHAWGYRTACLNDPGRKTYRENNTEFVLLPHAPLVGSAAAIEQSYNRPETIRRFDVAQ